MNKNKQLKSFHTMARRKKKLKALSELYEFINFDPELLLYSFHFK